jgi:hypothetical protein
VRDATQRVQKDEGWKEEIGDEPDVVECNFKRGKNKRK